MLKTIQKHIEKKVHKHIIKHQHKHVHKILHAVHHFHHTLAHMWELILVGAIWFSSLIFANYNTSYASLHRTDPEQIVQYLVKAMAQGKQNTNDSKYISIREMDGNVNNTFFPWYCTYGAARISPEFFPYTNSWHNQQRTWGGNAVDRCENAQATGFKISSIPVQGSLLVYKGNSSNGYFGHVGKVMYYNADNQSIIIREMNYIWKYIMTDRREKATNQNIKCFIYPSTNKPTTTWDLLNQTIVGEKPVIIENTPSTTNNTTTNNTTTTTTTNENNETTDSSNTETTPIDTDSNTHESAPTTENLESEITQQQTIEPEISAESLTINTENISDIAKHFFNQNTIQIRKTTKNQVTTNDTITITIQIKNKESNENYNWILPFIFNIISNNQSLQGNISTIQFINNGEQTITFTAKEKGESSIILTIDDQKVATLPIIIN